QWLQDFGLPLEDVSFQGGLIAGMRLADWQGGQLLDADAMPWFATLRELDLGRRRRRAGKDSGIAAARNGLSLRKLAWRRRSRLSRASCPFSFAGPGSRGERRWLLPESRGNGSRPA